MQVNCKTVNAIKHRPSLTLYNVCNIFLVGKLMPDHLVELPAVQRGRKPSLSRANTVDGKRKKKKKQKTSGASLPAIIDPPTRSPSSTLSTQGESVTKSVRPFATLQSYNKCAFWVPYNYYYNYCFVCEHRILLVLITSQKITQTYRYFMISHDSCQNAKV